MTHLRSAFGLAYRGSRALPSNHPRKPQERFSKRFSTAQAAGKFATEITAVEIASRKGAITFEKDEHNRPDTTFESLSKLKPAFRKDGTITAGNAPGLNTAASAMIVADRSWSEKKGLEPMARLVSYGVGAVSRGNSGLGPVPAVKQALERAGLENRRYPAYRNQ